MGQGGTCRTIAGMETYNLSGLSVRQSRDERGRVLDAVAEIRGAMERDGRSPAEIAARLARFDRPEFRGGGEVDGVPSRRHGYGLKRNAVRW